MNLDETRFFLTEIQSLWRTVEVSDTSVRVWQRQFTDVDLATAEMALDAYARGVSGDDYPPKPADILRLLIRAQLSLPTEDEAWRMVVAEVRRVGSAMYPTWIDGKPYRFRPGFPIPEVAIAVESIGWKHLVDTLGEPKSAGYAQLNFREAYKRTVHRTNEAALIMPVGDLARWRMDQAGNLQNVFVESPKGLFELGAPEEAAALIDGSGPRGEEIRLKYALATQNVVRELAQGDSAPISDEQMAANREKLEAQMRTVGRTPSNPAETRSALALKRGRK